MTVSQRSDTPPGCTLKAVCWRSIQAVEKTYRLCQSYGGAGVGRRSAAGQDGPRTRATPARATVLRTPACRYEAGASSPRRAAAARGSRGAGGRGSTLLGGRRSRRRGAPRPPIRIRYGRTRLPQLSFAQAEAPNPLLHTRKTRFAIPQAQRESRVTLKQIGSACLSTVIGGNDPTEASVLAGLRIRLGPVGSAREPTGPPFLAPFADPRPSSSPHR